MVKEVDSHYLFVADLVRHETGRLKIQQTDADTDQQQKKTNMSAKKSLSRKRLISEGRVNVRESIKGLFRVCCL